MNYTHWPVGTRVIVDLNKNPFLLTHKVNYSKATGTVFKSGYRITIMLDQDILNINKNVYRKGENIEFIEEVVFPYKIKLK